MVDRLFIIGIDGVDFSIAEDQGILLDSTVKWDLKEFPKLHTLRIWPSMYLGEYPHKNEHLVDPLESKQSTSSGANWYSSEMRALSRISSYVIPKKVRKYIGKKMIMGNVAKTEPDRGNWDNTVFDNISSKAINLPAYNPLSVQKRLKESWDVEIASENAGLEALEEIAEEEREQVRAELLKATERGYDLTWGYIYGTDIFGHIDFQYGYPRQVEKTVAEVINPLREELNEGDELVVISDHGMEEKNGAGVHRPPGWLTTTMSDESLHKHHRKFDSGSKGKSEIGQKKLNRHCRIWDI
jgi:hypothetical protein